MSNQLLLEQLPSNDGEQAVKFCENIANQLNHLPSIAQAEQLWKSELNEAYNAKEVLYLFSENVLKPIDKQVKQMISRNAAENAVIVAVSPLAIVDVLLMAARNIALVNKITKAYGMELGYISRLKLFKMVLKNMVFAGATEIILMLEWISSRKTLRRNYRSVPHKVLVWVYSLLALALKQWNFVVLLLFKRMRSQEFQLFVRSCLLRSKIRYLLKQKRKKKCSLIRKCYGRTMFRP